MKSSSTRPQHYQVSLPVSLNHRLQIKPSHSALYFLSLSAKHYDADTTEPISCGLETLEELLSWKRSEANPFNVAAVSLARREPPLASSPRRTLVSHDMMGGYLDDRYGCRLRAEWKCVFCWIHGGKKRHTADPVYHSYLETDHHSLLDATHYGPMYVENPLQLSYMTTELTDAEPAAGFCSHSDNRAPPRSSTGPVF